jgi:hypothetical protein
MTWVSMTWPLQTQCALDLYELSNGVKSLKMNMG